jgi:hypothetical protein
MINFSELKGYKNPNYYTVNTCIESRSSKYSSEFFVLFNDLLKELSIEI